MDVLILTISFLLIIVGIIGSFLPVLPGPPLSWLGLLTLTFTKAVPANYWVLGISLAVVIIVSILDYIIPAKGTKTFGGTKYGIWGTNIGLIVGLIVPVPFGVVIGPFVGALVGELIYNSTDHKRALKAATGSVIGFLTATVLKFTVCMVFLGIFLKTVWHYRNLLFAF